MYVIYEILVSIYISISRLKAYFTVNSSLSAANKTTECLLSYSMSTELFNLHFQSLEVVSRYRDTQLQVTENVCYLRNFSLNLYQYFKIEGIFYCEQFAISC